MRYPRRRSLTCQIEALEVRALLSGAKHTALAHLATSGPSAADVSARQATGTGQTTTPVSDVTGLQQHSSSDHLIVFLDTLAAALSSRPDVQQFATQDLATHLTGDVQIEMAARAANIILPHNISDPTDQASARQVLAAVNTSNFDQVYLATLVQVSQTRSQVAQQFSSTTQNAAIRQAVQPEVSEDLQTAQRAQALLANPSSGGTPVTGPSGTPTNDAQYVQQALSTNELEVLLSQAAALTSTNPSVQAYALKLVNDHDMNIPMTLEVGNYLGLTLSPTLSQMDQATARMVLPTLNTANFDQTYLTSSVQTHQMDIQTNQQEIARTQDPNVRQLAVDDVPTDIMHLMSAQTLLSGTPTPSNPFSALISNIDLTQVKNPRETLRHSGNGTLTYNLSFDSGGFHFSNNYNVRITGRGNRQAGGLTGRDDVNLFLFALYNRFVLGQSILGSGQGQSGSSGTGTTTSAANHASVAGNHRSHK